VPLSTPRTADSVSIASQRTTAHHSSRPAPQAGTLVLQNADFASSTRILSSTYTNENRLLEKRDSNLTHSSSTTVSQQLPYAMFGVAEREKITAMIVSGHPDNSSTTGNYAQSLPQVSAPTTTSKHHDPIASSSPGHLTCSGAKPALLLQEINQIQQTYHSQVTKPPDSAREAPEDLFLVAHKNRLITPTTFLLPQVKSRKPKPHIFSIELTGNYNLRLL
jgi:hypothetical protein